MDNGRNWGWRPLRLYASQDDDRAFVPKLNPALGATVNWANRTGLGFMIGIAVFIAVLIWATSSV